MSKEKMKMTRDTVPEGFSVKLALVDAIPVIFFGINCILIGMGLKSVLFVIGAALCLIGGAGKVLWKIIVATKRKNVWFLFMQMRIVMPVGFLMMVASVVIKSSAIDLGAVLGVVIEFPTVIFFALGVLGMVLMGVFAKKLDSSDLRSNWIEQLTNGAAQIAYFIGILLAIR